MIDGGKRAGDQDLKERRKRRKKAAENRINLLGEALRGHVDDEDGVLLKVYDDIQEELKVKTDVLKKAKQKVRLPPGCVIHIVYAVLPAINQQMQIFGTSRVY